MAKLITDRPHLVEGEEAKRIDEILKAAIAPCDRRNSLAHGRWWQFISATSTINVRGQRKGNSEWDYYTEKEIRAIGIELRTLALDLNDIKRAIENCAAITTHLRARTNDGLSTYFTRFHTNSAFPPPDAPVFVYFISSPVIVTDRF
jgi:hypothetical protein